MSDFNELSDVKGFRAIAVFHKNICFLYFFGAESRSTTVQVYQRNLLCPNSIMIYMKIFVRFDSRVYDRKLTIVSGSQLFENKKIYLFVLLK